MSSVILYVDDQPDLPEGLAELLERDGYELLHTDDAETAIRLAGERQPALILMEPDLADCDGLDLMRGLRDCGGDAAGLPVLVLSRAPRVAGLIGEAIALGASDILRKPALASELRSAIHEVAPPPPKQPEPAAPGAGTELGGDLSETPVPELLARLRRRGAGGVLIASRGRRQLAVQLRNGSPISVSSNRRGASPGNADDTGSDTEIGAAIGRRAEAELFESFGWSEGRYRFVESKSIKTETARDLARDPASVILSGVLAAPLGLVRDRLRKRASLYVSAVPEEDLRIEGVELGAEQERQLADLGGDATLGEILESGAFEERLLYGLWVAGRLELHGAPTLALLEELGADEGEADSREAAPLRSEIPEAPPAPPLRIEIPEAPPAPPLRIEIPEAPPAPPLRIEIPEAPPAPPPRIEIPEAPPAPTPPIEIPEAPPPPTPPIEISAPPPPPRPIETAEAPPPPVSDDPEAMAREVRALAQRVLAADDFEALDIPTFAPDGQVKAAYERILGEIPQAALDSTDPELRAQAARIRKRVEAAYAHLKDPETRRAHALLRTEEKQDRDARTSAPRALEAERWFRKGDGLLGGKRYAEAAEAFGMASHLDPDEGEYRSHLGYALYLSNPGEEIVRQEAVEHIASGIKRSPDRELPYVYLARILRAKGETESARKILRRALRIRPSCHPAQRELRLLEMREQQGWGGLKRLFRR